MWATLSYRGVCHIEIKTALISADQFDKFSTKAMNELHCT